MGEPYNGEEKGAACRELREKSDKTVGNQRERAMQTGREWSTLVSDLTHEVWQEGTDPLTSPLLDVCAFIGCWEGLGALFWQPIVSSKSKCWECKFAVGVAHKAPVVFSNACHLGVTDADHLGSSAGWDWVERRPEGSLTVCCVAFVLRAFNSAGHVLFKPVKKSRIVHYG